MKVMKLLVASLSEREIRLIIYIYLDDFLAISNSTQSLTAQINVIIPGIRPNNQQEHISDGTYPGDCILGVSTIISSWL